MEQSPNVQAPGEWVGHKVEGGKPGRWEVVVAYKGPCILPWLWEDVVYDGDVVLKPQPITFRAGSEGTDLHPAIEHPVPIFHYN